MSQTFATEVAGIDSVPVVKPSAINGYAARVRRYRSTITLAAQPSGDTIVLADIPAGEIFTGGLITSSVSLGTSTVSIGIASAAAKYKSAATFTAVDTPTNFGTAATMGGAASTAVERVLLTIATAALPASGTLVIDFFTSRP